MVRERKKGLLVYLILEDSQGKRKYHQVTKISNSMLDHHTFDNLASRDGDNVTNLASQLRSNANELLSLVTKIEKCNNPVQ